VRGFLLSNQSLKAPKSYHMLLEISFINITKVGTNMALFAFSSFLNALCSEASELKQVKSNDYNFLLLC